MPTIENDWIDDIAGDRRRYVPFMVSGAYVPRNDGVSVVGSPSKVIGSPSHSAGKKKRSDDCDDLLIVGAVALSLLGGE